LTAETAEEFAGLLQLRKLDVRSNAIDTIPYGLNPKPLTAEEFAGLLQLRKLDVRSNAIDTIPYGLLAETSIDRLYTHENPVHPVLKQQVVSLDPSTPIAMSTL
jgi:Leucine-rich repeat (LRR) protein